MDCAHNSKLETGPNCLFFIYMGHTTLLFVQSLFNWLVLSLMDCVSCCMCDAH